MAERPWNRRAAAHLYRRAGFGATSAQLDAAAAESPEAAVDRLLSESQDSATFNAEMAPLGQVAAASDAPESLPSWWLYRMLHSPAQVLEKATLFWHGHFAASNEKVKSGQLMLDQNRLLRERALGPFEETVLAVARDPAMLIYLDSETNRKIHPNENFAREVMELFCLGPGNYTEADVQAIARCFTGWEVRDRRFRFNPYQHDDGEKVFLGARGRFGGEDAVRIIVEQPATARFLAAKLYRFYVADEPAAPDVLLAPLAQELADNNLCLEPTLRRILTSNVFYSDDAIGRKVRSPVELAIGLVRSLEGTCSATNLARGIRPLGQAPFYPPNVKGWDGGRTWINSTTLLGRANLVHQTLNDDSSQFAEGTLADLATKHNLDSPERCVDWLAELLLAVPLAAEPRELLLELAAEYDEDRRRQLAEVIHVMSTLPEFQLA